jgi:hypothetical protein
MRVAAVTLPVSVAVLAVRTKRKVPVVVKPAMVGLALVPSREMIELPAINVPLLLKLPLSASAKSLVTSVPAMIFRSLIKIF